MEERTMADIISDLAAKSGLSAEQARQGMGALLNVLKDKLPADVFSKVQAAVPGSDGLMSSAAAAPEASEGGVLGAVKGMAAKVFGGGGGAAAALAKLQAAGVSPEQGQSFLRNVLEFLKGKLPEGVMKQISALIPV
jgi:hypothetical protein